MENSPYNIRTRNWDIRKKRLRERNVLDIEYHSKENYWIINASYKGKNGNKLRTKITTSPYVVLHDDRYIFWKFLEIFLSGDELREKKELFTTLHSRFDARYKSFLLESNNVPFIFIETGIGSASTYRVMEVLSALNINSVIKIGTISALQPFLNRGDVVLPKYAYADEGASKFDEHYQPDFKRMKKYSYYDNFQDQLFQMLRSTSFKPYGPDSNFAIWSVDAYENFDICTDLYTNLQEDIVGVEMECSALFSSSQRHKLPVAAILVVTRTLNDLLNKFNKRNEVLKYDEIVDIQADLLKIAIEMLGGRKCDG
jgi:uridine phosphorylase